MFDLTASLASVCIAALQSSSSVAILVTFATASDTTVGRFFLSSQNIASAVPFRDACSVNHAVALRVALDNLDVENESTERDLVDLVKLGLRDRGVDNEMVVTVGGRGGGRGG